MPTIVDGSLGVTYPVTAGGTSAVQASSAKVLQVVTATFGGTSSTNNTSSFVATGLTVNITPSSTSSKILITSSYSLYTQGPNKAWASLLRNGTNIMTGNSAAGNFPAWTLLSTNYIQVPASTVYLDSPSTTSSVTYAIGLKWENGGQATIAYLNVDGALTTITAMEIAA